MTTLQDKENAKNWVRSQVNQLKKHQAEQQVDELASFLKYLNNVVVRVQPQKAITFPLNQHDKKSPEDLTLMLEKLLEVVLDLGEVDEFTKMYKTSDLAKFMGVTVATINNWIKENRIRGAIKESKNAHAKIPETAIYISQTNEPILIQEIADLYFHEKEKHKVQSPEEDEMLAIIKFFNSRYGGTYIKTLAKKDTLTPQEQRDALEWKYVLERLGLLNE